MSSMHLRLASYNVHKCLGLDRRRSAARVLDVIEEVGADILALQEVDHRLGNRPAALPRSLIEARGHYAALPHAVTETSLGWHGQAILVRRGIEVKRIQRVALPGLEPRGAILAELETAAGALRIVGVHLGLIRRYRLMQMAAITAALSRHGDLPTAIIGDFNEWSHRNGVGPLRDTFHVHVPGPTYPALRPVGSLDRVAVGSGLHLVNAGVHSTATARVASDHLPVWAEVRLETVSGG